jgi:sugar/nucleoside kinase (ribokinase family)
MKNILLIGTSMIDQIFTTNEIHPQQCNKGKLVTGHGGSIHNVAVNLGYLDLNPIFVTKLGNDILAQEIHDNLSLTGVEIHPVYIQKPTPIFQSIQATNTYFFLSTISSDFLFNENDDCDYSLFRDSYVVTDQKDEKFLFNCMINSPSSNWILSGHMPHTSLLAYTTGIVLNEDEFIPEKVDFTTGLQWIIITSQNGATCLTAEGKVFIPCNVVPTLNTLGAGDAFLAGILYGLLRNFDLTDCIGIAHRTASVILQSPLATNPDLQKLANLL